MKKSYLALALEDLREDLEGNDWIANDPEEALDTLRAFEEFRQAEQDYDNLMNDISQVEQMQSVIESSDPESKVSYESVIKLCNLVIKKQTPQLCISQESLTILTDKQAQKQLALEGIGEYLKKAWETIQRILSGIWNWIKEFFGWQSNKKETLSTKVEEASVEVKNTDKKTQRVLDEVVILEKEKKSQRKSKEEIEKSSKEFIANSRKEIREILKKAVAKNIKKKSKNSGIIVNEDGTVFSSGSKGIDLVIEKVFKKSSFSNEDFGGQNLGIVETIELFMDAVKKTDLCFVNSKNHAIITSKDLSASKGPFATSNIYVALANLEAFSYGYLDFIDGKFVPSLKKVTDALGQSQLNIDAIQEAIKGLFPQARDMGTLTGMAKTKSEDNLTIEGSLPQYETYSVGFLTKDEVSKLAEGKSSEMGSLLNKVKIEKTKVSLPEDKIKIYISGPRAGEINQDQLKKNLMRLIGTFDRTNDFLKRYEQLVGSLRKATAQAMKNPDAEQGKQAIQYARMVLHACKVYLYQPLMTIHELCPPAIEATCDYMESYAYMHTPAAVADIL